MGESNFEDGNKRGVNWEFPNLDETQVIKKDYYAVLGLSKGASIEEVKEACRKKVLETTNSEALSHGGVLKSEEEIAELRKTVVPKLLEARDAIIMELDGMEKIDTAELPELPPEPKPEQPIPKPSRIEVQVQQPNDFERQKMREPEVWNVIQQDKHLRAVLAYCILTDNAKDKFIANRDHLTEKQVTWFYEKYPNLQTYNAKSKVMELPKHVTTQDKDQEAIKQQEYFNAVDRFTRLMYPESFHS